MPASWGQAYGGFKVGQDLYAKVNDNDYRQHVGLYVSHSRLEADVKGFALAVENRSVGDLKLDGDSVGVYWTLVGPQRGYLDAVLQYTDLDGRARSNRGDKLNLNGHAWTASLETGYPIALSQRWSLEPQAQLIAQKVSLTFDGIDRIKTDYRYTSVQLESGVVAQVSEALSLHGGVQYSTNLDSRQQEASGVNLGVRWQF